jgi:integrase
VKIPAIFDVTEMLAIIGKLDSRLIRTAVFVAGMTALRKSEIRGLKWLDLDLEQLWMNLSRGIVRKYETHMKSENSIKGIPLPAELAVILKE